MPDIKAWMETPAGQRTTVQSTCSFGRARTNTVVLPDVNVSRHHAMLHQQDDEYWLVDLGSANGTYVNGRRVSQPFRLQDNDRIEIGVHCFVFHHASPQTPRGTEATTEKTIQDIRAIQCWLMVADIEKSSQLVHSLPPEEAPRITGRWLAGCKQIIDSQLGTINKFLGDGFFAYWREVEGTPARVVASLQHLRTLQDTQHPRFRIVVHYGQVFSGGAASLGEESLLGNEVNFVFRMEKVASVAGVPRLLSSPARDLLHTLLPTFPDARRSVPGFEGEHLFHSF